MECNFSKPCVQWKNHSCLEIAECFFTECSRNLSEYHLHIEDNHRNKYTHGEEIRVSCDNQYEFENSEDSIYIQCMYGKWHSRSGERIPKCLPYSDCNAQSMENVILTGDNTGPSSHDDTFIIEHGSFARYVIIHKTLRRY